ncbi:hypothetical protein Bca4012_024417 [Brassica carinata]
MYVAKKPNEELLRRQCGAVFMRTYTNNQQQPLSEDFNYPLPNPNPNSISSKRFCDLLPRRDYVSFDIDGYSANQLKELKKRLYSELEQVRFLREWIESGGFVSGPAHSFADETNDDGLKKTKKKKTKHGVVVSEKVMSTCRLHDYHLIVKKPMDLGTVKLNLEKGVYKSPVDFAPDVRLTFANALAYNPKDHDVHKMSEKLLAQFEVWFNPTLKRFEAQQPPLPTLPPLELSCVPSPPPSPSPAQPPPLLPPRQPVSNVEALPQPVNKVEAPLEVGETPKGRKGKLPKPKAKDPNKRQMTMEKKAKLGVSLQELPPEKPGQLIQILKKRATDIPQKGDEIELDIEELDSETLWELDRFVTNYKKMASKIKRQGLSRTCQLHQEICAEKRVRKGGDAGEEDVDIGEDIPIEDYPSVEIEKDITAAASGGSSSSGSSSSSGRSSSSDSDSGSSLGSDSDADSVQSPFVEAKETLMILGGGSSV